MVHRYKIARGQLDMMIKMLESDKYCMDILHQSNAVQKAMQKADSELLKNHLETCVLSSVKRGEAEKSLLEILEVFNKK